MAVTQETWLDAQYSVLGSLLISPELTPRVLHETSERDFQGSCLTVYKAIRKVFQSGAPVDPVSVNHALGDGYTQFLMQLMEITPTAAHIGRYISLCKEQARTVSLRDLARQMAEEENPEKLRKLLTDANSLMVERSHAKSYSMEDLLARFMERHTGPTNYLKWPIPELNREVYASPGSYIVIAGLPSAGKTLWALQCSSFWARGKKVGFFSLETDKDTLFDRHISSITGISKNDIKNNQISQQGWEKICGMSNEIISSKQHIIPAAGYTVADIQAKSMAEGYEIIFVDYLQLIKAPGENRTSQVTSISIDLHTMAQSLGVTVVALSQMNRENGQGNRSEMSRLRESGQIEQDADVIMILSLEDEKKPEGNRILSIAKNKEGTRPKMLLAFDGLHQTFSKAARAGDVLGEIRADARRQKRKNQEAAQRAQDEQMTMLPDDYQVPF